MSIKTFWPMECALRDQITSAHIQSQTQQIIKLDKRPKLHLFVLFPKFITNIKSSYIWMWEKILIFKLKKYHYASSNTIFDLKTSQPFHNCWKCAYMGIEKNCCKLITNMANHHRRVPEFSLTPITHISVELLPTYSKLGAHLSQLKICIFKFRAT